MKMKSLIFLSLVLGVSHVTVRAQNLDPTCATAADCLAEGVACLTNGPAHPADAARFFCAQPDCTNAGRRVDGICNNLGAGNAYFGATLEQQSRAGNVNLANLNNQNGALDISDVLLNTDLPTPNSFGKSNLLIIFGQFVDHDITLVEIEPVSRTITGTGSIPSIDFPLSRRIGAEDVENPAFINEISALLDLTQVYGGEEERSGYLREGTGGRLIVQVVNGQEFLPENARLQTPVSMAMGNIPQSFAAGDIRANEQVILTAYHTLFVRNHNKLAEQFIAAGQNNEQAFENARDRNIAEYQNIVYNEFLPALLGANPLPPYSGYDATVRPSMGLSFSTALYRFGHSGVANNVLSVDEAGNRVSRILGDVFFNPQAFLDQPDAVGAFLLGSKQTCHERIDMEMQTSLRRLLFGNTGSAMDLGALNMERARDHQLPSFNTVRSSLGLGATSINQLDPVNRCVADDIGSLFGTNMDAVPTFVAGLAEAPQGNSQVGPTVAAAMVDQFQRLRDGDRYYFENTLNGPGFTAGELRDIRATTLSDVITRNTFVAASQIGLDAFSSDQCCTTGGNNAENLMCMRSGGVVSSPPQAVDRCNVENLVAINAAFYPGTTDPLSNQQYDCNCLQVSPVGSSAASVSAVIGLVLAVISLQFAM